MKDNRPSQGTRDMKKNVSPNFEARVASADPSKKVKAPKLDQSVFDQMHSKRVERYLNLDIKRRTKLISLAASALVVALSTTAFLNHQNIVVGENLRAFNIVLNANTQSSPNFGVFWHEGDIAAEYNYHLTGLDTLDRSNSEAKIYLIQPNINLDTDVAPLMAALGINNPEVTEIGHENLNPAKVYRDALTHNELRIYDSGEWDYTNASAKNSYSTEKHTNHICESPEYSNCGNSWKDILNLPTKESASIMALPILKAGGYKGDLADISADTETLGVPDGHTDLVGFKSLGRCDLWNKDTSECISNDPVVTANRAAGFGVEFSSGGVISRASGAFFKLVDLGETWTKSAYETIAFLKTSHQGIAWLSSPTKPPAAEHRIDINWDIQSATSGYSVMAGYDRDGKLANFVMPSFYYRVDYGQSVPTQIILASAGTIEDPSNPQSNRSSYILPTDDTSPECKTVDDYTICSAK